MKYKILLLLIILLGAFFRFYDLNWDQNQHLHPDERFLTMVGNSMKVPQDFSQYLNPQISTYNPTNVGYSYFVYGTFPLLINKTIAIVNSNDTYDNFTLQGRFLSALADLLIIFFLFRTVSLLEKNYALSPTIKYWVSFFYAISVLPIQLSHFFAVDTFLNLFMLASFYFGLHYALYYKWKHIALSALFFGFALASKVTAVFLIPLLLFLILRTDRIKKMHVKNIIDFRFLLSIVLFFFIFYVTLRLADPYIFRDNNFLNPSLNTTFMTNLQSLKSFEGKDTWYPPAIQWINKPPVFFSLANFAIFGIGIPYFICVLIGTIYLLVKKRNAMFLSIVGWTLLFFIYQSVQFVKTMRYFIFLYPFFAILAGIGFYKLSVLLKRYAHRWYRMLIILCVGTILFWPLAFFSIYTREQSRVKASEWIYQNIPNNSTILTEYWDDALPLGIKEENNKVFQNLQLPVFDPDTQQKWQKINNFLSRGDYLILSSNRGWGSISTVPEKYPKMKKFYEDLFDNKLSYKKIKEFTSYPSFSYLGIPLSLPDQWADEAFTVYDHPKVMIFKKI
jgi:4-amino-4-deoxy-L-arabinose transferase-like glycosyltransferase